MVGTQVVLVCDDEELIRWSLVEHLRGEGFEVLEAKDGLDCLEQIERRAPDLVITDIKMPRLDGLGLLQRLREEDRDVPTIVLTAHGGVDNAIEATKLGASEYLQKPFDLREISLAVNRVVETRRLEGEVHYLRSRQSGAYGKILGDSRAMNRLFETLRKLEDVEAPTVLLIGESGTGKDLIARAIHERGPRKSGPFMEVDCASLPDQLIESELFGHERGSFTDAKATKRGLFEVARRGTIFLDEIGEMSLGTQAKLLRALENRRFKRVGGLADLTLDAGVIAATNRNLATEVREGRFREDLYFRLNVIRIDVPSLRERREDVPMLAEFFVDRFNTEFARNIEGIAADAVRRLQAWHWPGNVRELRNVMERIVILEGASETVLGLDHLPPEIRYGGQSTLSDQAPFTLPPEGVDLEAVERSLLLQAMARTEGNQSAAARLLAISRYALRYRLEKYGMLKTGAAPAPSA